MKHLILFITSVATMVIAAGASFSAFTQPAPTPTVSWTPSPPITVAPPRLATTVPGIATNPAWMSVDYHRVTIDVENQIATTHVDMQFTNNGGGMVEGTFLFPLPAEAAVDNLTMYVNGTAIEAKILRAEEARAVYNEIVRQYRDPALLEYVGDNAVQANVFPIPPGESRRIEIGYTHVLEADGDLLKLTYPMETPATHNRMVNQANITVNVADDDAIRNIYSPTHNVAITRDGDAAFNAGFEALNYTPDGDFVLYYGLQNDTVSTNLLTFREATGEDGFFMLLVQPPLELPRDQVVPKDVILILDQSGSMSGEKWAQTQEAAAFVLDRLNPGDRFNVIAFSTGWRAYHNDALLPADQAAGASDWVYSIDASGGTQINMTLMEAFDRVDPERPTTILFMTDGLGELPYPDVLANVQARQAENVRIFTFGLGTDVNTAFLDTLSSQNRGTSRYVLPGESIEAEVSELYSKVSAPVLTDVELDIDGVQTDFVYPFGQMPDLFAGEQLTITGRYRDGADAATLTLTGTVNGEATTFTFNDLAFRDRAGGEPFIGRLWATRRIGDLLNQIRLHGENPELVDAVVDLSLRYGIITPYTSFLIEEDDILSEQGRQQAAANFQPTAQALAQNQSGAQAVADADNSNRFGSVDNLLSLTATPLASLSGSGGAPQAAPIQGTVPMFGTPAPTMSVTGMGTSGTAMDEAEAEEITMDGEAVAFEPTPQPIKTVLDKTFIWQNGVYIDTTFDPDTMATEGVVFFSDDYFALIDAFPALAGYFSVSEAVIVVYEGTAYEVLPE